MRENEAPEVPTLPSFWLEVPNSIVCAQHILREWCARLEMHNTTATKCMFAWQKCACKRAWRQCACELGNNMHGCVATKCTHAWQEPRWERITEKSNPMYSIVRFWPSDTPEELNVCLQHTHWFAGAEQKRTIQQNLKCLPHIPLKDKMGNPVLDVHCATFCSKKRHQVGLETAYIVWNIR